MARQAWLSRNGQSVRTATRENVPAMATLLTSKMVRRVIGQKLRTAEVQRQWLRFVAIPCALSQPSFGYSAGQHLQSRAPAPSVCTADRELRCRRPGRAPGLPHFQADWRDQCAPVEVAPDFDPAAGAALRGIGAGALCSPGRGTGCGHAVLGRQPFSVLLFTLPGLFRFFSVEPAVPVWANAAPDREASNTVASARELIRMADFLFGCRTRSLTCFGLKR